MPESKVSSPICAGAQLNWSSASQRPTESQSHYEHRPWFVSRRRLNFVVCKFNWPPIIISRRHVRLPRVGASARWPTTAPTSPAAACHEPPSPLVGPVPLVGSLPCRSFCFVYFVCFLVFKQANELAPEPAPTEHRKPKHEMKD